MLSNRVLSLLLFANIVVTSLLLFKIGSVTNQLQEAKDSFRAAVDTISAIKTVIVGGFFDKAMLVKQGINHVKDSEIVENFKNKLWGK